MTAADLATALCDQPNRHARPASLATDDPLAVHGYQEYQISATTISPSLDDRALCRKRALVERFFAPPFLAGKTVLDLGANGGFFSFWAHQNGAACVRALEMDGPYLRLMRAVQELLGFDRLQVVQGKVQDWREPADVVLGFALVHWLYSCTATYGSLDAVIHKLAVLTRSVLLVEWVDPHDEAIRFFDHLGWNPACIRDTYSLEAFEQALRRYFGHVEILGEVTPTRRLYAAACRPNEVTVTDDLPLLASHDRILSSRCLVEFGGRKYFSRVYRGDQPGTVWKQATDTLAVHEADILRRLRGPYFPRIFAARQESGYSVAEMEWIDGENLTTAAPQVARSPESVAVFMQHCLAILESLQAAGIQHRDIRDQNILVRAGTPVLIDFGWAEAQGGAFPAPPGLGRDGRPPDGRFCDVYAMGKILGRLLPEHCDLFAPLIGSMTADNASARITETGALRNILRRLVLPAAWGQRPARGHAGAGGCGAAEPRAVQSVTEGGTVDGSAGPAGPVPDLDAGYQALAAQAWVEACDAFIRVLERDRDHAPARSGLGMALVGLGQLDEGIAQLEEGVRLLPDPHLVTNLACGYLRLRRYAEAERLLEGVLTVAPEHAAARANLARLRAMRIPAAPEGERA